VFEKNLKCIIIIIIITLLFTTFNILFKNMNDDIGEKTRAVMTDTILTTNTDIGG